MMYQAIANPWCDKLRSAVRVTDGHRARPALLRPFQRTANRAGNLIATQSSYGWRVHATSRHKYGSSASKHAATGRQYVTR